MGGTIPSDAVAADQPMDRVDDLTPEVLVIESLEIRILEATARCVARWGVTKTTIDDIAREAGTSRATVYRVFPAGKQALLVAAGHHEVGRMLRRLDARLALETDLAGLLAAMVQGGAEFVATSEPLQYLVAHEPAVVLPHVSFDGLEPLLHRAAEFAAPHLRRFLDEDLAWSTGEWMARVVTAYAFDDARLVDLTDLPTARRFVETYVLPGLTPTDSVPAVA